MDYETRVSEVPTTKDAYEKASVVEVDPATETVERTLWESTGVTRDVENSKLMKLAERIKDDYKYIKYHGGLPGHEALAEYGHHQQQTKNRVQALTEFGYLFFAGNNPRMDQTKRWARFKLMRVAQTNSRFHGRSDKTLWAVRPCF